jgi:hypothetical protein
VKKAFSDTIIANSRYPMSKETMQEIVGDPMFGVTNVKDDDGVFEMICDLYKMYVEDQNDEIEDHSKSNKRGRTEFDEDE